MSEEIKTCQCGGRYWQLHCIQCGLPFEPAVAERDALKAKLARYEKALRWYMDRRNYYSVRDVGNCAAVGITPEVLNDNGERARQALGEEPSFPTVPATGNPITPEEIDQKS